MAFETILGDLTKEDSTDANKILSDLLSPKNIDMKTEIQSPFKFAFLETISITIEKLLYKVGEQKLKFPKFKAVLKNLLHKIKVLMVSHIRKSRGEITSTLQAIREEGANARNMFQRLTGMGK